MGKAKKRNFTKNIDNSHSVMKRDDVISDVLSAIKSDKVSVKIKNLISLFGITPEELAENGASFEEISSVKHIFY